MNKDHLNQETNTTEVKVLGEFKPKRRFLSFVSAVASARVRLLRDTAFIKGEKLSGMLEGAKFKITICDEGTINFEEVDTNLTDKDMRKRLLDDIDSTSVTGYAQKFVVSDLEFTDIDGGRCYLEVEHQKPFDKLKSLFDEEEKVETKTELSDKGASILDALFSSESNDEPVFIEEEQPSLEISEKDAEIIIEALENPAEPNDNLKGAAQTYIEESFRKMNEDKINELKRRIEGAELEASRLRREIISNESKLKKQTEDLKVLETRLSSFNDFDTPTGYVFYVSDEQKPQDIGLSEENRAIADKIADIMGLKKDVLFGMLTKGYYKIRIAEKSDINAEKVKVSSEILEKMMSLVNSDTSLEAKVTMTEPGHFEYRGSLNWHQIVDKMIRKGFEQEPEFDKLCQSNSYNSHEEEKDEMSDMKADIQKMADGSGKTKIESVDVRTYDEETTLVIMGTLDHNDNRDVKITDDYTSFGVYVGDKRLKASYESDGFISIMTLPEFKKWQAKYPEALIDSFGVDSFLLPNFKGTIGVTAVNEYGGFTTKFNLSDYIKHQIDDVDVFLTLPEGTEIVKMNDYHKVPVDVLRDIKINKIIK